MFVHALRGSLMLALAGLLVLTGDEPKLPPPAVAVPEVVKAPDTPPKPKEEQPPSETARIRKMLNQPTDKLRQGIDPGQSLKDVLDFIGRSHGLTFRVDYAAFKQGGLDNVADHQLKTGLPATRNIPLGTSLQDLLLQLEPVQGAFLVKRDHIVIVPVDRTMAEYTMRELVRADFDKLPVQDALKELAEQTGTAVIFDAKRAGEKAKTPITATLQNVSLGTAVQLLANMAELKAVMVDNTVYVTTEENAAKLEENGAAAPVPHGPPSAGGGA
jgi:hypothetical protein